MNQIELKTYQSIIEKTLQPFSTFCIDFQGATVSASGVVAKGYDPQGTLNKIRDALRLAFKQTNLPHTIDKRYVLKAAHSTLIRFKRPLQQPAKFAHFLEDNRDFPFGKSKVTTIDLVYNDWCMKAEKVQNFTTHHL
ncbi:MAG: hypothetical protein AAGJ18_21895 [Bacteroidota bacterium]